MLSPAKKQGSLTGKLLLSTALVAVTVGYGWWQQDQISRQQAAAMAAMQRPSAPAPAQRQAQLQAQLQAMAAAPPQTAPPAPKPAQSSSPGESVTKAPDHAALLAKSNPPKSNPSTQLAMAAPSADSAPATPAAPPGETALLPATPPTLNGMDSIRRYHPIEGVSPPLPPVTGTPDPGAAPPIPAGTHLEDGDYESEKIQFEWGDLRVRTVVTGGRITTVQIVTYPDHRSQSLYLIQLADPILTSEVIKSQQSKVDIVTSATNTSIAFQDAIASAIIKATR